MGNAWRKTKKAFKSACCCSSNEDNDHEVYGDVVNHEPNSATSSIFPGTGKTLIARALANECSFGSRKVSFFMRKGADLLSKWVGESEKQLRLLFEQAAQMKPSIIFFDEIDGLAPVRSSRQDQIHASIVSTLLALMDGLDNRGEVIVIGATNRIDAIDPALRRPGRFDRELFFPLPARKERESILRVVVSSWRVPPSSSVLSALAEHSSGYCGGDLRALATEAVIHALSRVYPQVYTTPHRLHIDPTRVQVEKVDLWRAWSVLVPAAQRVSPGPARRLCPLLEPLLRPPLTRILALFQNTFPHGIHPALANIKVCGSMQAAVLLVTGEGPAQGQSAHLAPALLHHMEHVTTYTLELAHLYRQSERTPEEACVEVFNEARRNVPSVVYVPSIEQWWSLVGETVRAIFLSQLTQLDPSIPILLLATANVEYKYLPEQISSIFSTYRKEVLHLSPPVTSQREAFFKPLIISACLKAPKAPKRRPKTPPPLPRAPTPPPEPIDQNKLQKIYEKEEETLRELRIFLRDICKKLASNKAFYMFTKPVDLEEVPDYLTIIKQPMDLETMMTKVDLHRYSSAQEFLADIDLICMNALEYNPAKTTADKQIRHRACSLRDYAYSLIKAEMDSDFEEQCRDISRKRKERKASVTEFLPPFIHTVPNQGEGEVEVEGEVDEQAAGDATKQVSGVVDSDTGARIGSPQRKRKMTPLWARGYLSTRKRRRTNTKTPTAHTHTHHAADTEVCILESVENIFSEDESKENKPGEENKPTVCVLDSTLMGIDATTLDVHTPLSVNCDLDSTVKSLDTSPLGLNTSKQSKLNETLSPAIWPSFADLLEDSPQIDDGEADEANENQSLEQRKVIIDVSELDHVLSHAVSVTQGCSVLALMDLYGQLNKLVSQYSRTHERKTLPQELTREISRFQENQKKPSRCSTPPS